MTRPKGAKLYVIHEMIESPGVCASWIPRPRTEGACLKGALFSPDPDREGNIITAEGNPCPNVFCDGPSQSVPIPHFVTARHKQTCPPVPPFITRRNTCCFHHTVSTLSGENVIGDIHEQADSLGVPCDLLEIERLRFGRTPSPCAVRATNRTAVAAVAMSNNRRQIGCCNLPPSAAGICRY